MDSQELRECGQTVEIFLREFCKSMLESMDQKWRS